MYIIWSGHYYSEGSLESVYHKKVDAIRDIQKRGFKQEKNTGLFINGEKWYRIDNFHNVDLLA